MTSRPTVSVLVPTYNYARFLPEAIESVLAQDFTDFELLISDDCSTDGSAEVLRHYAGRDPRIQVRCQPSNLGMVQNWNWCLQQARGRYIKFLFGDDCLATRHALGRMATVLEKDEGVGLVASARHIIDERSQVVDLWSHVGAPGIHWGRGVVRRCLFYNKNLIGEPSVVMFRNGNVRRGFDTNYRQVVDLEMWCHILARSELAYIDEPLCQFRLHSQQQTVINQKSRIGEMEFVTLLHRYMPDCVTAVAPITSKERNYLFYFIYNIQKRPSMPAEMREFAKVFRTQLGSGWYAAYLARHRFCRPFANLCHAWEKHVMPAGLYGGKPSYGVRRRPISRVPFPEVTVHPPRACPL